MQRFIVGTCQMHLRLTPLEPWMVRGQVEPEVFTDQRGQQSQRDILQPLRDSRGFPLLPASSFKGVLRSTAERILRSVHKVDADHAPLADEPFVHNESVLPNLKRGQIADSEMPAWNEHHKRYPELLDAECMPRLIYRYLSAASQLFGATTHAGLVRLEDARVPTKATQRRSHVALDRFTGGVGEGPFIEQLAPSDMSLETTLTINNFALWQIGLLGLVFQEFNRGYIGIGASTRKGQGQVRVDALRIEVRYTRDAYNVSHGIISAQARLADEPWRVQDVPRAVAAERGIVLLAELERQLAHGWREQDITLLLVQEEQVQQLFREAVDIAWRAWIAQVAQEDE
ncbi:MAG: hypothetical protein IPO81_00625 [Kouleothrix sp.]|nr:hypothetical protein [Kouleothrix sp.]